MFQLPEQLREGILLSGQNKTVIAVKPVRNFIIRHFCFIVTLVLMCQGSRAGRPLANPVDDIGIKDVVQRQSGSETALVPILEHCGTSARRRFQAALSSPVAGARQASFWNSLSSNPLQLPSKKAYNDLMSIAVGLSATKTAFELIKNAVDLLKGQDVDVHEVQARLIELQGLMLDARSALVDAEEENRTLRDSIRSLEAELALKGKIEKREGVYWLGGESGKLDGPYCPLCYGDGGKLVPLTKFGARSDFGGRIQFWCQLHKHYLYLPPDLVSQSEY